MYMKTIEEKVHLLETPSLIRWLVAALIDWAWIVGACAIAFYYNNLLVYIIAIIIIGSRRHALTLLGHDGTHFLITKNKALNDFLAGFFVFWPSFVGVLGYRLFHIPHHMFLGSQKDLELLHKKYTSPEWDLPMTKNSMIKRVLLDCIGFGAKEAITIFRMIGMPHKIIDVVGPVMWWSIVSYILYLYGGGILALKFFLIWNVAMLTSFIAIFRLRMWSEHLGTVGVYRIKAKWWQAFLFLPHNTWYHFEHHAHRDVPFWNLPKLRPLDTETPVEDVFDVFKKHYSGIKKIASGEPLRIIPD